MADSEVAVCNLALSRTGDSKGFIGTFDDPTTEAQQLALWYPQKRDELLAEHRWKFARRRAYPAQIGGAPWSAATVYAAGQAVAYAPLASQVANTQLRGNPFVYVSLIEGNVGNTPSTSPTAWLQISRPEWDCVFQFPTDVIELIGIYPGLANAREDEQIPYALEIEPSPGPGQILLTNGSGIGAPLTRQIGLSYTARIADPKQFPAKFTSALAWDLAVEIELTIRKDVDAAEKAMKAAAIEHTKAIAWDRRQEQKPPPPVPSFVAARFTRRGGGCR